MSATSNQWKGIIKQYILAENPNDFGPNCIDIYLVVYVSEKYRSGRTTFCHF